MTEILKQEKALKKVEKVRVEMSEGVLPQIVETVAVNINKAVESGLTSTKFTCNKGYKSISEIQAYITPLLVNAGYNDFEITNASTRCKVWFRIGFKKKQ
ncbi:MAG: hypothetical protein PQJ44_08620 [Sphaerochaetaceae bacterium]|nr:hypothetical protein [Sphaerochaetaceae bacterium]